MIVSVTELRLDPMFFYQKVLATLVVSDFMAGVFKCFVFSFFISVSACYFGLNVKGGTQGVGAATRGAVVTASILILVGDFFLTKLIFIVLGT